MSRITGWTAHIIEQAASNSLIRPLSAYSGREQRALMARRYAASAGPPYCQTRLWLPVMVGIAPHRPAVGVLGGGVQCRARITRCGAWA